MDPMKRIIKARTQLLLDHPFFGTIALNMPMSLSEDVKTAATNGKRVIFNPDFVEELTDEELKFLVAHEVCHPMLEHPFRMKGRDHRKWNMAGDYVINKLLHDEGIGKMPEGGLLDDHIYQQGGGTTDGIYNILPDPPPGDNSGPAGGGSGNGPLDDCEPGEGTPAELEQQAAEWKVGTAQAAQTAKMMGKLSANLERFVGEVLQPKVNWEDVMRRFLVKCKSDNRSFARPNRRFLSQGLYLPTASGETLGDVVFAVDCSGSIGPDELNQFAAEVRAVKEDFNPTQLHVLYFDSEICHYDKFGPDDELHMEPHGGGGTAFSPIFAYCQEHGIDPVACVVLTDMYCNDFGPAPSYPVLWVSTSPEGQGCANPFGELVIM